MNGWARGICGGWSAHVEQGRYGHPAKKATWLYAFGVQLPALKWGKVPDSIPGDWDWNRRAPRAKALVSWCGNHMKSGETRPRVGKRAAAATPPEFGEILIAMAKTARVTKENAA